MLKPRLQFSRSGLLAAGLFLALALAVLIWILYSSATNPGDSGESGILLLPFAMPWVMIIPPGWLGPKTAFGAIGLNAWLLYLVFGGLRFLKKSA